MTTLWENSLIMITQWLKWTGIMQRMCFVLVASTEMFLSYHFSLGWKKEEGHFCYSPRDSFLFRFDIHIWEWPIFACQVYFQEYRPGVTSFCIVFICCCCAFMINWLRCSLLCLDCFEVVSGSVSFLFPFFCTRGFLYLTRIGTSTSIQTCLFSVLLSELESDWKKKA